MSLLCNASNYRNEIWKRDAQADSERHWHLKFEFLNIQDGGLRTAVILNIYISPFLSNNKKRSQQYFAKKIVNIDSKFHRQINFEFI